VMGSGGLQANDQRRTGNQRRTGGPCPKLPGEEHDPPSQAAPVDQGVDPAQSLMRSAVA